ncbi:MAG: hypothetical protein LIV24_12460, partial [Eubacterium sp.]|nr:hypothetical protein [Eubacterium sp.]
MEKTGRRNSLITFFTILTAVLLCIAFFFALIVGFGNGLPAMSVGGLPSVCKRLCKGIPFSFWPQLTLLLMLVFLFLFLRAAGKWIDCADRKKLLAGIILLTAFLLILQLAVAFGLNIIQNTDSFEVQDQAMAIAKGMLQSVDYNKSAYFRKYGNNDLYLLTCIGIYRLCGALSVQNWQKVFVLVNMLCVDTGILLACDIVRCLRGSRAACKAYLLCVLNPLNYLLLHWTYTCTFSVPLMMLGIWLAVRMHGKTLPFGTRAAGCMAIGFVTVIGYYMRPTAVFPVIALLLAAIFQWFEGHGHRVGGHGHSKISHPEIGPASKHGWQKLLILVLTVVIMGGTAAGIRHLNRQYDPDSQTKFPIQHWIMIGLRGSGRVTGEDIQYTEKFSTKEEKKAADELVIHNALKERGPAGTILHYVEKIGLTWSDGTAEYYQRTTESENSQQILYQLINGEYCGGLLLYCQAFRILLLLLTIFSIFQSVFHRRMDFFQTVFTFAILGGLLFYIIWEGKPVYSYPFIFCLILAGCCGWVSVADRSMEDYEVSLEYSKSASQEHGGILIHATLLCVILLTAAATIGRSFYVADSESFSRPSIVCDSKALSEWNKLAVGDVMTQEFYPAYRFNHIRIAAQKGDMGYGAYQVTLSSQG